MTESFTKKVNLASTICMARINPSAQPSQREQEFVTLRIQCMREYHPEDIDYAAAVVRERFCNCYSRATSRLGSERKSPTQAVDYCSRKQ
jgi:hypothetical protein